MHDTRSGDRSTWLHGLSRLLTLCSSSGADAQFLSSRLVKGFAIDLEYLQAAQCRQWDAVWEPYESLDPRLPTCLHRGLAMYACFMRCGFPATHYLMSGLSWRKKLVILRWRLGVIHMLAVHLHGLPYEDRLCVHHMNDWQTVQDALHVLGECPVTDMYRPEALQLPRHSHPYLALRNWWQMAFRTSLQQLADFLQEITQVFTV